MVDLQPAPVPVPASTDIQTCDLNPVTLDGSASLNNSGCNWNCPVGIVVPDGVDPSIAEFTPSTKGIVNTCTLVCDPVAPCANQLTALVDITSVLTPVANPMAESNTVCAVDPDTVAPVRLTGSNTEFAFGVQWTNIEPGGGMASDGQFVPDATTAAPMYLPGPNDVTNGEVFLRMTALADVGSPCANGFTDLSISIPTVPKVTDPALPADVGVCALTNSGDATFSVAVNEPLLNFQWQFAADCQNYIDLPDASVSGTSGENTDTLIIAEADLASNQSGCYRCRLTNIQSFACPEVFSRVSTLCVNTVPICSLNGLNCPGIQVCGDNVVDGTEECDPGAVGQNTATCDRNCTLAVCGDGFTNTAAGEECDDGNNVDGDGCQGDCMNPVCGDGITDAGEECDDGNLSNNDACLNDCTNATCGDAFVQIGVEDCDLGSALNGLSTTCCTAGCDFVTGGTSCDDNDVCNGTDTCNGVGTCDVGVALNCNDGVGCTDDSCDPVLGCMNVADDDNCDDNDVCNGLETCDAVLDCQAGTALNCDDGVGCTDDSCDTVLGCINVADDANCDDNDVCNGLETCDAVLDCQAGTALVCDDSIMCTIDSCDPVTGCVNFESDAFCSNSFFCDGPETCDPGAIGADLNGCVLGTPPCTFGLLGDCEIAACNEFDDQCQVDDMTMFPCDSDDDCNIFGNAGGATCNLGTNICEFPCTVDDDCNDINNLGDNGVCNGGTSLCECTP